MTALLGAWLIGGLFIDGWAHNHQKPESIFTPWHAALYSGFGASAWYAISIVRRTTAAASPCGTPSRWGTPCRWRAWLSSGWAPAPTWRGTASWVSRPVWPPSSAPPLVMFCGAVLVLTGPFRAAWAELPALLSLTLTMAPVALLLPVRHPVPQGELRVLGHRLHQPRHPVPRSGRQLPGQLAIVGLTSVLITNLIYVAPLILCLRRRRLPAGTATILFGSVTLLVGGIDAFNRPAKLAAGVLAGVAVDILLHAVRPSAARPWTVHGFAAGAAFALWALFFAVY